MADKNDKEAPPAANDEQDSLCGQRLAEARLSGKILIADIAKELHISEDKVQALESNDFDALGAAVFAKGYIRKYAQMVGLEEADLLAEYEELASASTVVPVLKARPRLRREMSPGPWIAVIVVIIIAATAYWWFTEMPFGGEPASPASPVEMEPEPAQERIEQSLDTGSGDSAEPTEVSDDVVRPAAESVAEAAPVSTDDVVEVEPQVAAEPLDDDQLRMSLTFSGDCWTEISDGNGRRLFFGLGNAGRTVELSGEPPFNALFGNVANVRIQVNGVDYAVKDLERRGRTARLTVTGS